jgi:hypothetical protein
VDQIYVTEGLQLTLRRLAGAETTAASGNTWHVFGNDVTPDRDTRLIDLTLIDDDFIPVALDESDLPLYSFAGVQATILGPSFDLINGGISQSVYGYAIVAPDGATLIAAARFDDAPRTVAPADPVSIVPTFSDQSELP